MKRVVFLNDLKESDIRPDDLYKEYKKLLTEDIRKFFGSRSQLVAVDCPGCLAMGKQRSFQVMGLTYAVCDSCGSWYVSPRPKPDALKNFFKTALSVAFSHEHFTGQALSMRATEVFSYRLQWIQDLVQEHCPKAVSLVDFGGRYPSFLENLLLLGFFRRLIMCLSESTVYSQAFSKDIILAGEHPPKGEADVFCAFEQIERSFLPSKIVSEASLALKNGGLFILTTATSSGFEYQVLGEYSPNLNPIDRMNLISFEALIAMLRRSGFRIIEASTPGRLDVEMVKKAIDRNPSIPVPEFWAYVFKNRSGEIQHQLQEFLQQFQLSSHVRIAAVKE